MSACPFCAATAGSRHLVEILTDNYPSAPGHRLVVPTQHVERVADLTDGELLGMWTVARDLTQGDADGYTVGINDGPAAGQTVPHVHLHVIPRHHGDVPDPRGGVRWVLPDTAPYWEAS